MTYYILTYLVPIPCFFFFRVRNLDFEKSSHFINRISIHSATSCCVICLFVYLFTDWLIYWRSYRLISSITFLLTYIVVDLGTDLCSYSLLLTYLVTFVPSLHPDSWFTLVSYFLWLMRLVWSQFGMFLRSFSWSMYLLFICLWLEDNRDVSTVCFNASSIIYVLEKSPTLILYIWLLNISRLSFKYESEKELTSGGRHRIRGF